MELDQSPPPPSTDSPSKRHLSRWEIAKHVLAIVFAIGISVAIIAAGDTIEKYQEYGYLGVFIISVLGNATLILPVPSFAVVIGTANTLNPYLVGFVAGFGSAIGEMTGYLAGYGGSAIIENADIYKKLVRFMRRWGAWVIFALALVPNPIFDIGGIVAGSLKMPWWKFLGAATVGKSVRLIIFALMTVWGFLFFS
ncbi:MAG TPA: DedA family protein [Chloroflexi bacterium]|nr:DedA family protein [Chloroflexota bacterium]